MVYYCKCCFFYWTQTQLYSISTYVDWRCAQTITSPSPPQLFDSLSENFFSCSLSPLLTIACPCLQFPKTKFLIQASFWFLSNSTPHHNGTKLCGETEASVQTFCIYFNKTGQTLYIDLFWLTFSLKRGQAVRWRTCLLHSPLVQTPRP